MVLVVDGDLVPVDALCDSRTSPWALHASQVTLGLFCHGQMLQQTYFSRVLRLRGRYDDPSWPHRSSAPLTQFYPIAFSAFVDVYLAVYPAIVLFGLQMSTKKKIALSCALGIGSVYVLSIWHASLLVTAVTNGRLIVLVLLLFTKQLEYRLSQATTSLVGPLPALFRRWMGNRKADFLFLHR